jgi:hypothetical protein
MPVFSVHFDGSGLLRHVRNDGLLDGEKETKFVVPAVPDGFSSARGMVLQP